jgi:hypothetical protein
MRFWKEKYIQAIYFFGLSPEARHSGDRKHGSVFSGFVACHKSFASCQKNCVVCHAGFVVCFLRQSFCHKSFASCLSHFVFCFLRRGFCLAIQHSGDLIF